MNRFLCTGTKTVLLCILKGPGRGDEGRDGDEVRIHGPHGDHSSQR
jgi:hypothetical protein